MIIFMVLLIVVVCIGIASYGIIRYGDENEYSNYYSDIKPNYARYRKTIYYYHDDNVE